jgi:hypothetical protein
MCKHLLTVLSLQFFTAYAEVNRDLTVAIDYLFLSKHNMHFDLLRVDAILKRKWPSKLCT